MWLPYRTRVSLVVFNNTPEPPNFFSEISYSLASYFNFRVSQVLISVDPRGI